MDTAAADGAPAAELRRLRIGIGADGAAGAGGSDIVRGVDLALHRGRVQALVGESGSGKTLTASAFLGLLPEGAAVTGGQVLLRGEDTAEFTGARWRAVRGDRVAMVFQDPLAAFNPAFRVGRQVAEPLRRHRGLSRAEARERATALMAEVGIPDPAARYRAYPHELSGGMRQRAVIAMALALGPDVLLADEPTTALDVTVQAQILRLLARRRDPALLLVSHDLGVVARVAHDIAVMYAGRIVETGPVDSVYSAPSHPYTRGLLAALPDPERPGPLQPIPGRPPAPGALPAGCAFAPRCPFATRICTEEDPALEPVPGPAAEPHAAACHHAGAVLAAAGPGSPPNAAPSGEERP